ncbi:MAG: rod shape-determining protein MreD [bacterium]|nr:rod shape-determining protein MreD [bacterium]
MASKIRILIIIFLAVILETSFFPALFAGTIVPDVVLVLIILWSSRKKFEDIWLWAIWGGFFLDLAIFGKIGINAVSFVVISFMASFLRERFFIAQRTGAFVIALTLVTGGTILNWISTNFLTNFLVNFSWKLLLMKITSNLVVAIFMYFLIARYKGVFGINESKLMMK